ncbi:MAG: hypothetical protein RBS80_29280 [Thermoguttaceae bacterium]|jgi:hypothetical protein|nr:hypothetical protein [Thermoguttaceae bacterium]
MKVLLRRLVLGILLGEAFLVLGVLDAVRARIMAEVTGIDSLEWIAPVAQAVFWSTTLFCNMTGISFDQDPIHLFAFLLVYWAVVGIVALQGFLLIRRLFAARGCPAGSTGMGTSGT